MIRKGKKWTEDPTIEEIRRKNMVHLKVKQRQEKLDNLRQEKEEKPLNADIKTKVQDKKKPVFKKIKSIKHDSKKEPSERPKGHAITWVFATLIWIVVASLFLVGIGGLYITHDMLKTKPELHYQDLVAPESTIIYDANNEPIIELGEYKRENISYEQMPNSLIDAFLAIEDSRFFTHFGFDIPRFSMAIIANLKSGSFAQGGSTFNMQLIKNSYFQLDRGEESTIAEKKISRKVQEIVLAIEADHRFRKQDIMALYLNRINFGNNIRGVQKAAQYYFNKNASELTLSESAFLAGIINSPNIFNPYNDLIKDNADNIYVNSKIEYLKNGVNRRNEVLDMMAYHGYISNEEAGLAKTINLEDELSGIKQKWSNSIDYYQSYIDAVIEEAKEVTGKDPALASMEIHTNMDPYMQKLVYDIQNENTEIKYRRKDMQSAIVTMNNQTGEIVALGGGRYQEGARQWNRATMSKIQPGSTVKPIFEYLLAFEELGWATSHTITDQPIFLYGSDHLIHNAIGEYIGDMLIPEAVARSLNTPAIQTLEAVIDKKGRQFCIDYLKSVGFDVDDDTFDLQYAIGGNAFTATPVQLAGAHAVIMNEGKYIKPHTIKYIDLPNGEKFVSDTEGEQVVSPGAAFMVSTLLYHDVYGPWFNYMQILKTDFPVYAKTGTTDWGKIDPKYGIPTGSSKDSWLVCQTSNYTNSIWLGFDHADNGTYFTSYDDNINTKGQIGRKLILEEVKHFGYEPKAIPMPDDVTEITHVKGVYPYVEPKVGTPVTGYILKKYNHLNPVSSIKYETKEGTLAGISGTIVNDNTVEIRWLGVGGVNNAGMKDLTAVAISGKTEHAVGRQYFPLVTFIPPVATYYADVYVDGELKQHIDTSEPFVSINVDNAHNHNISISGGWSNNNQTFDTKAK